MGSVNPDNTLPDGAPAWVTPSLVADTIEWGDHLGGETARFDKHGIDRFLVELAIDNERS